MRTIKNLTTVLILLVVCYIFTQCQNKTSKNEQVITTDKSEGSIKIHSENDLAKLANKIVGNATTSSQKTKRIIDWSNKYLEWNESDYVERDVIQIINQKGGTCGEQSITVRTLMDLVGVKNRECAEINIQPKNEQREIDSKKVMEKYGLRMSVFGLRHNDHRWVEFYDEKLNKWVPADPTLKLFGFDNWVKSRIGFNERPIHEVINSKDMIVPIAIVAIDKSYKIVENRSDFYLINQFNKVYNNELQNLPSWKNWIDKIQRIAPKCELAFKGELDLHKYNNEIEDVLEAYNQLKKGYCSPR